MSEQWVGEFDAELFYWRGPAPYYFLAVPAEHCDALAALAPVVSYGWGMIPVTVVIGDTEWTTALWPKEGGYVVPIKTHARRAESLEDGELTHCLLRVDSTGGR